MLEAKIEISDELAAEGFRRAMSTKALIQIFAAYGGQLAIVWIAISILDAYFGAGYLIPYNLIPLGAIWVYSSLKRYLDWSSKVAATKGWSFYARLDEESVVTNHAASEDRIVGWDFYKNYVEYDDYLQIEDHDGNYTFVPKTPELFPLVEFTKRKIPER